MERLDPAVIKILRSKTPLQRWEMAFAANRLVRQRIRAHLRYAHPEWDEARIASEVARRILWNKQTS
jgi:hypothetical protein